MEEISQRLTMVPYRIALVALVTVATVIGLSPYVLFVGATWVLIVFGAFVAFLTVIATRRHPLVRTAPMVLETGLALTALAALAAFVALAGLLTWALTRGLVIAVAWSAAALGWESGWTGASVARGVSLFVVAVGGLSLSGQIVALIRKLHPKTDTLGSAFSPLARKQTGVALAIVASAAATAGLQIGGAILVPTIAASWWFTVSICVLLFGMGTATGQIGDSQPQRAGSRSVIPAIMALFESGGFRVIPSPRTGREDLDPLLAAGAAFFATNGRLAFAVDAAATPLDTVDEERLSALSSAAWALDRFLRQSDSADALSVTPVYVVVGPGIPPILRRQERMGLIRCLHIPDAALLAETWHASDESVRQEIAERVLGSLLTHSPERAEP